jgi:hypothetical protein
MAGQGQREPRGKRDRKERDKPPRKELTRSLFVLPPECTNMASSCGMLVLPVEPQGLEAPDRLDWQQHLPRTTKGAAPLRSRRDARTWRRTRPDHSRESSRTSQSMVSISSTDRPLPDATVSSSCRSRQRDRRSRGLQVSTAEMLRILRRPLCLLRGGAAERQRVTRPHPGEHLPAAPSGHGAMLARSALSRSILPTERKRPSRRKARKKATNLRWMATRLSSGKM